MTRLQKLNAIKNVLAAHGISATRGISADGTEHVLRVERKGVDQTIELHRHGVCVRNERPGSIYVTNCTRDLATFLHDVRNSSRRSHSSRSAY